MKATIYMDGKEIVHNPASLNDNKEMDLEAGQVMTFDGKPCDIVNVENKLENGEITLSIYLEPQKK